MVLVRQDVEGLLGCLFVVGECKVREEDCGKLGPAVEGGEGVIRSCVDNVRGGPDKGIAFQVAESYRDPFIRVGNTRHATVQLYLTNISLRVRPPFSGVHLRFGDSVATRNCDILGLRRTTGRPRGLVLDELRESSSQLSKLILHMGHNDLGAVEDIQILVAEINGWGIRPCYVWVRAFSIGAWLMGTVVPRLERVYCPIGIGTAPMVGTVTDIGAILYVPAMVFGGTVIGHGAEKRGRWEWVERTAVGSSIVSKSVCVDFTTFTSGTRAFVIVV